MLTIDKLKFFWCSVLVAKASGASSIIWFSETDGWCCRQIWPQDVTPSWGRVSFAYCVGALCYPELSAGEEMILVGTDPDKIQALADLAGDVRKLVEVQEATGTLEMIRTELMYHKRIKFSA